MGSLSSSASFSFSLIQPQGKKGKKEEKNNDNEEKPKIEDVGSDKEGDSGKDRKKKTKIFKEKYIELEELNKTQSILMRKPDNVTQEE
jgi:molecular chaperone HtpG